MMKILHVITGLEAGGAEATLFRLCKETHELHRHFIVSLTDDGTFGEQLRTQGITVVALGMRGPRDILAAIAKLRKIVRQTKPDVIQTWMYHADLIGGIAGKSALHNNIVWGIRHTNIGLGHIRLSTFVVVRTCAFLSHILPNKIVLCSQSAIKPHSSAGYKKSLFRVVPNGYPVTALNRSTEFRDSFRREINARPDDFVIGMVARYDVLKDHRNLAQALREIRSKGFPVKCVLIGRGIDKMNTELMASLTHYDVLEDTIMLGHRSDIDRIMQGLDVHVLSSMGEAFPNVVAEAMANGTPCVSTDVGDCKNIVGEHGWIVEPRNPVALAAAIINVLEMRNNAPEEMTRITEGAMYHIRSNYSVKAMADKYINVWKG
jgi:glycosyltransferase involved in cell wall biosynthesis